MSLIITVVIAQKEIPAVYSNIYYDADGKLYHKLLGLKFYAKEYNSYLSLNNMCGNPKGTRTGIKFDFGSSDFSGTMYYGLIDYTDSKHPSPVWYKRTSKIINGIAEINIKQELSGKYDMSNWEEKGFGTLGYRLSNEKGELLYDGIVSFIKTNLSFEIVTTIIEGPFINLLTDSNCVISFETNFPVIAKIEVNERVFNDIEACKHHEIKISDLSSSTCYDYEVTYGVLSQKYSFKTAPKKGSRKSFVFAYASDSRSGQGGGERDLYGTNYYVMRKISALANFNDVAFMQFTGDLVSGYSHDKRDINLQYANWKRAIEPYAHYFPIIAGIGNHEAVGKIFENKKGRKIAEIAGFPFETESSSAVFASNFVNPHSSLISEDGAYYDPNPDKTDFPPYDETVFWYAYDNVAIIVLNSNYFYAHYADINTFTSGNIHAYIMDNQLEWLETTINKLENYAEIDHIFVTQHTPAFPNGGHVKDDMWYNGNNKVRPYIAGNPVKKGIIERRDEYLDIIINKSSKVVAMLTGDEHNYNKVKISPEVNLYPKNYKYEKLKRKRTIWQINNGSAGAPYYAQEKHVPWTNAVSSFTTQQALVLFYVNGKSISVKVFNPDTLELVDKYILRK